MNKNRPIIKGYLKEVKLIDLEGKSLGEAPHYFFKMTHPIKREYYISDSTDDLEYMILKTLYKNRILSDTNYHIDIVSGELFIEKRELFVHAD